MSICALVSLAATRIHISDVHLTYDAPPTRTFLQRQFKYVTNCTLHHIRAFVLGANRAGFGLVWKQPGGLRDGAVACCVRGWTVLFVLVHSWQIHLMILGSDNFCYLLPPVACFSTTRHFLPTKLIFAFPYISSVLDYAPGCSGCYISYFWTNHRSAYNCFLKPVYAVGYSGWTRNCCSEFAVRNTLKWEFAWKSLKYKLSLLTSQQPLVLFCLYTFS